MRAFRSLTRSADFAALRRRGAKQSASHLTLYRFPGRTVGPPHVGLAIGKPVGKAVERNLVRRRLKAALERVDLGSNDAKLLLVARPGIARLPFGALEHALRELLAGSRS